jgi:Zn finger protein HypA/HybF involved in hydrogenase expression
MGDVKHGKDCNWIHYCEGTKLTMEINAHPDEPSLWIEMENKHDGVLEGMYMSANFCPQCGVDLRTINEPWIKQCPECNGENISIITENKFICDQRLFCLNCGSEFGQTLKGVLI